MADINTNYEDVEVSRANHVVPNVIKRYQENKKMASTNTSPIDDDVMNWLEQQDDTTKHHVNEVIRHLMAVKPV